MSRDVLPGTVVLSHSVEDWGTSPTQTIIKAVCSIENIDPMDAPAEIGFVLYDCVDPESIDILLNTPPPPIDVQFRCSHYHISATNTGELTIRDCSGSDDTAP